MPGSPLDPRAQGTNDLIRGGATLCGAAEHVTAVLAPFIGTGLPPRSEAREPGPETYADEPLWDELDLTGAGLRTASRPANGPAAFDERIEAAEAQDEGTRLSRLLGPSPVSVDELARQSGLPVRAVQRTLLELELAGRIERHGGNSVSIVEAAGR